jgi:hypothetical protein
MIPTPRGEWSAWAIELIRFLQPWIGRIESEKFSQGQILRIASFTVADLPDAATPGRVIYVSDETGGAVLAFSDGTNWRRVTDRLVVA